jgi:hypothetical protein
VDLEKFRRAVLRYAKRAGLSSVTCWCQTIRRRSTSSSARTARDRSLGIVVSDKVEQFKRGLSLQRLVVIAPHR